VHYSVKNDAVRARALQKKGKGTTVEMSFRAFPKNSG